MTFYLNSKPNARGAPDHFAGIVVDQRVGTVHKSDRVACVLTAAIVTDHSARVVAKDDSVPLVAVADIANNFDPCVFERRDAI